MAWPADLLHPLPPSLTAEDGALLEPLGVAIHAVDLGKLRPGQRSPSSGAGRSG